MPVSRQRRPPCRPRAGPLRAGDDIEGGKVFNVEQVGHTIQDGLEGLPARETASLPQKTLALRILF